MIHNLKNVWAVWTACILRMHFEVRWCLCMFYCLTTTSCAGSCIWPTQSDFKYNLSFICCCCFVGLTLEWCCYVLQVIHCWRWWSTCRSLDVVLCHAAYLTRVIQNGGSCKTIAGSPASTLCCFRVNVSPELNCMRILGHDCGFEGTVLAVNHPVAAVKDWKRNQFVLHRKQLGAGTIPQGRFQYNIAELLNTGVLARSPRPAGRTSSRGIYLYML